MKAVSKVKTKDQETPSIDFPILMKDLFSDLVALFLDPETCVVIVGTKSYEHVGVPECTLGQIRNDLISANDTKCWTPFTGEITLKNE